MVPMDTISEQYMKFTAPDKGLRVLCFVPEGNIPREQFMDETSVVMPEPNNESASKAMSAFVHAMTKTGKAAVARAVWRANSSRVIIGVLTPCMGTASRADGMYFNELPFSEDYRPFQFASFEDMKMKPDVEQIQAMKDLIRNKRLDANDEQLQPETTGNPKIAAFYQALAASMGHTSATKSLKELDTRLSKRPCRETDSVCAAKGEVLARYLKTAAPTSGDAKNMDRADPSQPAVAGDMPGHVSKEGADKTTAGTVGVVTNAHDFLKMMAQPAQRKSAMSQVKEVIVALVQESIGNRFFQKALELLTAMRQQCTQLDAEHATDFNDYFMTLKSMFHTHPSYSAFWQLVVDSKITLVTDTEVPGCTATADDARDALLPPAKDKNVPQEASGAPGGASLGDIDDDFDDME
mmetsp:Transcript_29488/g.75697  ORF Transcript_29488/g.75697 Transcript_29488/m.75697 type:complete len:409 (+) Transcript_29488:1455-2681(+)